MKAIRRRSLMDRMKRLSAQLVPPTLAAQENSFIVFSDFDGTITTSESDAALMKALGVGASERRLLNQAILHKELTHREAYSILIRGISERHPLEEALGMARQIIKFDPGFKEFWNWCKSSDTPLVIISSSVVRAALEEHLGPEDAAKIHVFANEVKLDADGRHYSLEFRHPDSTHGHEKSRTMKEFIDDNWFFQPSTCIFIGDGVSDMSAVESADLLFVKVDPSSPKSSDLKAHCKSLNLPFKPVVSFFEILNAVGACVEGRTTAEDLLYEDNLGTGRNDRIVDNGWTIIA
ncbi:hypothetical protein T439DRAFT_379330 [Meredithblackwellia eburnea MCA 4105]